MSISDNVPDGDQREQILDRCEERIGYRFKNRKLLLRALTHSSCASTRLECNERMEFLGDAILGLVVCQHLYHRYPAEREGHLTQLKSRLVSRSVCTDVGNRLDFAELLIVGKGLQAIPDSLIAAGVESVIAAVYLDGGLEAAREFILRAFEPEMQDCDQPVTENYKSLLQERVQREGTSVPRYIILEERGPDHAREFRVAVELEGRRFSPAWGRSKKQAEQLAAQSAIEALDAE